jgi:putative glutamine amidotransferase
VAHDVDGIVQAVEQREGAFRVGVQWHPEYLGWQARQRRLFRALVSHARVVGGFSGP